jgi:hypothetical protein
MDLEVKVEERHWVRSMMSGLLAGVLLLFWTVFSNGSRVSSHTASRPYSEFVLPLVLGAVIGLLGNRLHCEKNPIAMIALGAVTGILGTFWLGDKWHTLDWSVQLALVGCLIYGDATGKLNDKWW